MKQVRAKDLELQRDRGAPMLLREDRGQVAVLTLNRPETRNCLSEDMIAALHALAKRYCPKGAGAVFTFGLKGGYDAGVRLVSNVKLFSHLANIGDTRSLIIHPASTTHRQLTDEARLRAGAGPDVVRLSIGLEDVADIVADLDQALEAA